jgi:hypothetical protein
MRHQRKGSFNADRGRLTPRPLRRPGRRKDGTRAGRALRRGTPGAGGRTHELYLRRQARLAAEAKERDSTEGETCTKYRERLDVYRKELGRRGGRDDANTWKVWLAPHIGHLPVARVSRDDVEKVRDALDEAIALHRRTEGKEGIGAKRAANVWSVLTTTFKAASTAT